MAVRVPVSPTMLTWALQRSGMPTSSARYEQFSKWAAGDGQPTFKQLEGFAHATHTPLGYLFLPEPPEEPVPIPDFRTLGNNAISAPSPDLLDTIYEAQRRQDWFRSYAADQGHEPFSFVGSATIDDSPAVVADEIRRMLDFGLDRRARFSSWEEALRQLIDSVEQLGVLVMVSGIVGSNTHRILDPNEFRGFALTDPLSSLVFVNGADTKSAQIFTLIHELAHIWLGETALSDAQMANQTQNDHELWANNVAAEVLVPSSSIKIDYRQNSDLGELQRLARLYKVSTLVVLKRIFDNGFLTWDDYRARYQTELERLKEIIASRKGSGGGDYYNTQPLRISQSFARAVIVDALEGRTLYRDAFSLLGAAKRSTFEGMANKLGVA
ncbi:ImmA/IrrE family metallo-endopeptidase [Herbiconiux sp. VKM Ac-1786]|nr:ImmA/IrrE family metallo-endopeptidase [Herbiconiux sp. VKM Ac-1786]